MTCRPLCIYEGIEGKFTAHVPQVYWQRARFPVGRQLSENQLLLKRAKGYVSGKRVPFEKRIYSFIVTVKIKCIRVIMKKLKNFFIV